MSKEVERFYARAKDSVNVFNEFIWSYGLFGMVNSDHICYKCESGEEFEEVRKIFENNSRWIYQAIIARRRIATIRTNESLETSAGRVSLVELSDQKQNGSQKSGFDHIEIYPTVISYESLVSHLEGQGLAVKEVSRPHHTTHDLKLDNGFIVRLSRKSLLDIISREMT